MDQGNLLGLLHTHTSLEVLVHPCEYHELYTAFTLCQFYGFKEGEYPSLKYYVRPLCVCVCGHTHITLVITKIYIHDSVHK